MTDQQKLAAIFTEFGIGFHEIGCLISIDVPSVEEREAKKIKGYNGFGAEFEFDASGRFIAVGVWE